MKLDITPLITLEATAERLYRDGDTPRLLTRERVRQIESAALRKLEEGMKQMGYGIDDVIG